jgi:hypothetical protein
MAPEEGPLIRGKTMGEVRPIPEQNEQKLRDKLTGELDVSSWKGLIPDMLSKSFFFVSKDLDLVEVGVQVALDRTSEVKHWLDSGLLKRPTEDQIRHWETFGSLFQFIIVEPYVFFQEYEVLDN